MSLRGLVFAVILCLLLSALFFLLPQLDLKVSLLFYQHHHFVLARWMIAWRNIFYMVNYALLAVLGLLIVIACLINSKRHFLRPSLFLLLCFALGPGLLVNVILKDHWGRPRPIQITQFGGTATFQKPWVISQQCRHNCSFVAGDPSAMFAYFALLIFLRNKKWRYLLASILTGLWLWMGFIRIAEGGHFLSDVFIGATLVYMVIWLSYYFCYQSCFSNWLSGFEMNH